MDIELEALVHAPFKEDRYARNGEPLIFGVEHERVITNLSQPGVASGSREIVRRLSDLTGVAVKIDSGMPVEVRHPDWGCMVTTDAGKGVLEIAYDPCPSLHEFVTRSRPIVDMVVGAAREINHEVIGVGRHPLVIATADTWVPKARYGVLQEGLVQGGHETCETASHQVTVDARNAHHLLKMLRVGNALSGPTAALFANAGIFHGNMEHRQLASRAGTWQRISRQPNRVGIPVTDFQTLQQYVRMLFELPYMLHVFEDGSAEYFDKSFAEAVKRYGIEKLTRLIMVNIGCVWWDARWRLNNRHSVEYRVACSQRQGADDYACTAFFIGLSENAEAIHEAVVSHRSWSWWREFRKPCVKFGLDACHGGTDVKEILRVVLHLVREGLCNRGLGEERYLDVLDERVERGVTPAQDAFTHWGNGGMEALVEARRFHPSTERKLQLISAA